MKLPLYLLPAVSALLSIAGAAPVAISDAGLVYTENFNTLAAANNNGTATTPWTDDATLPGWWLYRAGTGGVPLGFVGTNYSYRVADGTAAISGGNFFSMGASGSGDRALGNPSSTAPGELSAILIFQNTGTLTMDLTQVRHNVEILRNNQNANLTETQFVWWRTGATLTEVRTMTTATATSAIFPDSVADSPGSDYVTGWNRFSQAEITYTGGAGNTPVTVTQPVNVTPSPRILLQPGQFFAIRYSNINDIGTDHLMGIDDVELTWTPLTVSLEPVISNVVRQDAGTPRDPSDDTVDFTLTVNGTGGINPAGWTATAPVQIAGQTGLYGVPKNFTGVPIAEFTGIGHTTSVAVEDTGNPAAGTSAMLTAPWCTLTAVFTDVVRNDQGTPSPLDDTWGYTVTVDGQFTGASWTSTNSFIPTGSYGAPQTVSGVSVNSPVDTMTFIDVTDTECLVTVSVAVKQVIGSVNFGAPQPLYSDGAGVPAPWVAEESGPFQRMENGGGAPARFYRSEVLDLSTVGQVKFTGSLLVNDSSSGFETADTFNAQLIIDGNTAAPVSLIALYDTITPPNGLLTGAEITPASAGPPPATGAGDYTLRFFALIPENAGTVQLVISGNNDSTTERMTVQELKFELATHSLEATASPGVEFNNQGTIDPADDTFSQGVNITAVNPPPGSTGWTSNSIPDAGLYGDPNPVVFGPYLMANTPSDIVLTDNGVPTVTATVDLSAPVPAMNVTYIEGFVFANGAGPEDDTVTITVSISAPVGGPEFRVYSDYPVTVSAESTAMSGTPSVIDIEMQNIPTHGPIYFYFEDLSYPGSGDVISLTLGPTPDPQFILGKKDIGLAEINFVTLAGSNIPAEWQNYPAIPAVGMNDGFGPSVLTSEIVNLTGINGPVYCTANLRVTDESSGFEAADTFKAELILNGDTANPINLITPYDTDGSGVMNGGDTATADEFNAAKTADGNYVSNFPLSFTIPDNVNSVQLVIIGGNDSLSEYIVLEKFLLSLQPPVVTDDTDGDGVRDTDEAIMGTNPDDAASVTRLAQSAESPAQFTFSAVAGRFYRVYQSVDTAAGFHLTAWQDSGLGTISGAGLQTVNVTVTPDVARRFYRLHVMESDGPWPASLP